MSDLDAVLVGIVLGLAIVGAALLRDEEKIREAWRQRRGSSGPKTGGTRRWMVVCAGLIASVNIGLGVASSDAFHIILGTFWLLFFCLSLREYTRSQGST